MSSRSGSGNNVNALILGGISLLSLAGLCFYLYSDKKKTVSHKGFKEHKPDVVKDESNTKVGTSEVDTAEDSEELLKKAEEVALKEAYDDALRLAK